MRDRNLQKPYSEIKPVKKTGRWYPGSWGEAVSWEQAAPPSMLLLLVHLPHLTLIPETLWNIAGVITIIFIYSFAQQALKQV